MAAIPHLDNIIAALDEESITVCYPIAAFAWALHDYFLTIRDEIEYIWKKPFHSGSWLFIWVRYYGLTVIIFNIVAVLKNVRTSMDQPVVLLPRAMDILATSQLLHFVLLWSVQVVMQMRVYAVYMSRRLAAANISVFVLMIAAQLYLWLRKDPFHCKDTKNDESPLVEALRCGRGYPFYWVPVILFDLWLGSLATFKFVRNVLHPPQRQEQVAILTLFLRDSAMHYVGYMIAIVLFNVFGSFGHSDRAVSLIETVTFIIGTRLILHLRQAYYQRPTEDLAEISGINFRSRTAVSRSRVVDDTFWGDR